MNTPSAVRPASSADVPSSCLRGGTGTDQPEARSNRIRQPPSTLRNLLALQHWERIRNIRRSQRCRNDGAPGRHLESDQSPGESCGNTEHHGHPEQMLSVAFRHLLAEAVNCSFMLRLLRFHPFLQCGEPRGKFCVIPAPWRTHGDGPMLDTYGAYLAKPSTSTFSPFTMAIIVNVSHRAPAPGSAGEAWLSPQANLVDQCGSIPSMPADSKRHRGQLTGIRLSPLRSVEPAFIVVHPRTYRMHSGKVSQDGLYAMLPCYSIVDFHARLGACFPRITLARRSN